MMRRQVLYKLAPSSAIYIIMRRQALYKLVLSSIVQPIMRSQVLYKFSAAKRYTNLLSLFSSAHEVELPEVDRDKDRHPRPLRNNYYLDSGPSE